MKVTVDASTLVAFKVPSERAHADARQVLTSLFTAGAELHQPMITLIEVPSAIRRRVSDATLARDHAENLLELPDVTFHPLDMGAALEASALAIAAGLRAADATYLATAVAAGATLITLDAELRAKAPTEISVMTPAEWLAAQGGA